MDTEFGRFKRRVLWLLVTTGLTAGTMTWVAMHSLSSSTPEALPIERLFQLPDTELTPEHLDTGPEIRLLLV